MKRFLVYTVSLITCLYFLFAGNICLFSKVNKSYVIEIFDIDEDAAEKDGKTEKEGGKEDKFDEENFLSQNDMLLPTKVLSALDLLFPENGFSLPTPSFEISSPPPKA